MRRLLFTGGGGAGNEAIYRLWHDRYDLHFADAEVEAIDPSIPYERRHVIPYAHTSGFADSIIDLCRTQSIDVLVPGVDEELPAMSDIATALPKLDVLVPEKKFVLQSMDKFATANALANRGLPAPRTATMEEKGSWPSFPCIAKPRCGRGSRGVQVLRNSADVSAYLQLSGHYEVDILLQQLIEGREFTVMVAADRAGNLHAIVPVEVEIKRGITIRARINMEANVVAGCRAIHEAFRPRGCYNVQLILTPDGAAVPFEINPRISTTFCLGIAAGVDPVEIYCQASPPGTMSEVRNDLCLHRHWTNVIH